MMTDPIADMLTRIRNACQADHKWVDMPVSKKKIEIARLLEESHFVHAHKVLEDGRFGVLRVYLKYHDGKPVIRHLERVSRPGRRHYVGKEDIPRVRNGLGMAILSTSAGLLTDRAARERGVGGEVLAKVW
jgi:small subunit ribosomal protein S8